MSLPLASLSLDMDNQWSYMKTHGNDGWETFPSYLPQAISIFLEFAAERDLESSVFIVGQDAALDFNAEPLAQLGESRHEIGNHSFNHEPWLHLNTKAEIFEEVKQATEAIHAATGRTPRGFRGPGYSLSTDTLDVLSEQGYQYDASTLPTWVGPLARAYYFRTSQLDDEERERRGKLFGGFGEARRPLKPYRWQTAGEPGLVEIPVTTMPFFRTPMHISYLHYFARISEELASAYLRTGLRMCLLTGVEPSVLLHPLDFLGPDDVTGLDFFPGMDVSGERKRRLVAKWIDLLIERYRVVSIKRHVAAALGRDLKSVSSASL